MDLPLYILVLLVWANRWFVGLYLKLVRRSKFKETDDNYEPTVAIVTPMFNEGQGVFDSITSMLALDYPAHKLSIIVVDDCSTDDSYTWASLAARQNPQRVTVLRNRANMGKRKSIARAVRATNAEIIVSIDSDVVVDPQAIRALARRFTSPRIAAVGGRVFVSNPNESWLTRMQVIKYFLGYEYLKSLERAFHSVMCLSGCLTAYRRSVLLELESILENRNLFGVPIKYGEDRFLTRQIVKAGYETYCTMDAFCWTTAPSTFRKYFAQQLRWRRSNLVDIIGGVTHVVHLHPVVGLHYMCSGALLVTYPIVVLQKLMNGAFWELAGFHMLVLAVLGTIYAIHARRLPRNMRVHPLCFLSMTVVMPVTYIVCTTLAMFTLDSSSWETRGHSGVADSVAVAQTEAPAMLRRAEVGFLAMETAGDNADADSEVFTAAEMAPAESAQVEASL
jgi:cellulose synthase/poly-beta-1,6-N-acetylglucosamine synthase-like glycosyltransferase